MFITFIFPLAFQIIPQIQVCFEAFFFFLHQIFSFFCNCKLYYCKNARLMHVLFAAALSFSLSYTHKCTHIHTFIQSFNDQRFDSSRGFTLISQAVITLHAQLVNPSHSDSRRKNQCIRSLFNVFKIKICCHCSKILPPLYSG